MVNHMSIVIRVHNLPCLHHNVDVVKAIGDNFGQFLKIPKPLGSVSVQTFRVKSLMDVTLPLKRDFFALNERGELSNSL